MASKKPVIADLVGDICSVHKSTTISGGWFGRLSGEAKDVCEQVRSTVITDGLAASQVAVRLQAYLNKVVGSSPTKGTLAKWLRDDPHKGE